MSTKKPQLITRTDGIARKPERRVITGIPDSTWDTLEQQGKAPTRVPLGPRCVGWDRGELFAFNEQRKRLRKDSWQSLGDAATRVVERAKP
jgi:predicted DNA-binding transcriptional regulator AlpA